MLSRSERILENIPVGSLGIIPLLGCEELGNKVNDYLVKWRRESAHEHKNDVAFSGYEKENYLINASVPRFGSGEAKGILGESVRGKDIYLMVDVCNYNVTYSLTGNTNHMSPDDHFQNLKRIIAAVGGKGRRINVIMPFLYESRQHKRTSRESLDCALALQELVRMGVDNIITFDAHDPRVSNAIPLSGFETISPTYQFIKGLLRKVKDLQIDSEHMMAISPDEGGTNRAVYLANVLGLDMGMFYKRRDYTQIVNGRNPIVAHEFLGSSVEGKDVIIIDEMSMVDLSIMYSLIKAVNVGTRLVLVGDADQLPSVGAGNILSDIIKSECLPVVKLEKIFRQDAVSDIIANAHKINKGEYVDLSKKSQDFFFIRRERPNDIINAIYALISDKLPKYVGCDAKDIQILAPSKMTDVGVNRLNEIMQSLLNPPAENKEEIELFGKIYRVGDKVIHIKNNYNMEWKKYDGFGLSTEGTGVFNGDTGVIRGIESTVGELEVVFDDGRYVTYSKSELEQLELAYALTVHKAQGSEYPAIIMPMYNVPRMLLNRKLLYTAVTRAKKCVCLVGIEEIFNKMKDNEYELKRYSTFDKRLKEAYAEFI